MKKLVLGLIVGVILLFGKSTGYGQELKREDFNPLVVVTKLDKAISILEDAKKDLQSKLPNLEKTAIKVPVKIPSKADLDAAEVQENIKNGQVYYCVPCKGWRFKNLIWRDGDTKWTIYVQ